MTLPSYANKLDQQRSQFIKAEKALKSGNEKTYKKLATELHDYPLYPYLEYQYLQNNIDHNHMSDIQIFLAKYQDMPLTNELRLSLIKELSAQQNWKAVIQNYRHSKNVAELCHYLYANQNLGKYQATNSQINKLWLTGRNQVNECDPVFEKWLSKGVIGDKLVWHRLNLVMQRSNRKLGNYLVKHLSGKYQSLGKLYLQINQTPMLLTQQKLKLIDKPNIYKQDIIANGLSRLAYKNPTTALKLWETFSNTYNFTKQQEELITEKLARGFTRKKPARLKELLDVMKPNNQNHLALEFLIRYAIRTEDWQLIQDSINKLPPEIQEESPWQYWHARSLEQSGKKTDAEKIFLKLAKQRNYYGFLSAAKLKQPYAMHNTKISIDKNDYNKIKNKPAIARVRELMLLDRQQTAYNEWSYLINSLDEKEKYIAAQVAFDNFWPYLALRTAARAKHQDDLELRFPRMFKTFVRKAQKRHQLDPELVYAMIRQESFFQPTAKSYAGARGLMQLMPGTAADMAKKINMQKPQSADLYRPAINIRLGTEYIRFLLEKFNNNIVLAVAAYNAGPHRVEQWLPDKIQPADIWVESIPFHETREYVKYVTTYMLVYQYLLGQQPSFDKMYQPIKEIAS